MRNKKIILILFLYIPKLINAQSIEDNLNKYWYYRDRLEQDFMIVGSPELQGTNWPAEFLLFANRHMRSNGENPTHPFSDYLCVLATEYRLLKNYGQNDDAAQTLQKIAWALQSFDRVDLNCEKFFRARQNGLADNDPYFWTKIDNYIHPSEDLNGFFLRGDMDSECSVINGWCQRTVDSLLYPPNPSANILDYNNGQLRQTQFLHKTINNNGSNLNTKVIETNNRTVESQDEVWGLLLGLAFINKLVDDTKTFKDLEGNYVTIRKWAKNITWRVVRALSYKKLGKRIWWLKNPLTNESLKPENGGGTLALAYLFAKAGNKICGNGYNNLQTIQSLETKFLSEWALSYPIMINSLINGKIYIPYNLYYTVDEGEEIHLFGAVNIPVSNYGITNLAMIAGEKNLSYYYFYYNQTSLLLGILSNERLPAIYTILNDINIKKELTINQYNTFKNSFLYILNQSPDCGSWVKKIQGQQSDISDSYWYKNRNSTINAIYSHPESLLNYDSRYTNGLDYMLMHNLYWLLFMTPPETAYLKLDFPFNGIGTNENPFITEHEFIDASNHINTGGNVTYKAKSVRLKQDFRVYHNATFRAISTGISAIPIYSYRYFHPECQLAYNLIEESYEDKEKSNYNDKYENKYQDTLNISTFNLFPSDYKCYVNPNPFNNILFLNFNSKFWNNNITVSIYNLTGSKIYTKHGISQFESINTSDFNQGLYILKVQKDNEILTYKIIKQ